jgi:hypothetical protein
VNGIPTLLARAGKCHGCLRTGVTDVPGLNTVKGRDRRELRQALGEVVGLAWRAEAMETDPAALQAIEEGAEAVPPALKRVPRPSDRVFLVEPAPELLTVAGPGPELLL